MEDIKTNNFGNLTPSPTSPTLGVFDATPHAEASTVGSNHVWVGCVTTNSTLASVAAQGTEDMKSGLNTLPLSDVSIGLTNASNNEVHGGVAGCEIAAGQSSAGACTLTKSGPSQTLVTNADEGTTELNWQYQLNLPANQPVGSYTGGEVVLTATAEASASSAPRASSTPTFATTPAQGTSVGLANVSFSGTPAPALAYQWRDCESPSLTSCTDIPGATSATYTPTASDQGFYLSALVTATNMYGNASESVSPVAVNTTYMQAVEADHPVADWTFNDPAGSTSASDSVGWGTLSGGTGVFGVPGPFTGSGTAMELTSGYLWHSGTPLDSPTVFSLELWFKPTSAEVAGDDYEYIIANQEGWIWLGLAGCTGHTSESAGPCLIFEWQSYSKPAIVVETGYRFTDTNWHYIVMSHGEDGLTHIYVDGVEYGPFNSSSQYYELTAGTFLGGVPGSFSHVAYYDSELSAKRVAVHWQASKTS